MGLLLLLQQGAMAEQLPEAMAELLAAIAGRLAATAGLQEATEQLWAQLAMALLWASEAMQLQLRGTAAAGAAVEAVAAVAAATVAAVAAVRPVLPPLLPLQLPLPPLQPPALAWWTLLEWRLWQRGWWPGWALLGCAWACRWLWECPAGADLLPSLTLWMGGGLGCNNKCTHNAH